MANKMTKSEKLLRDLFVASKNLAYAENYRRSHPSEKAFDDYYNDPSNFESNYNDYEYKFISKRPSEKGQENRDQDPCALAPDLRRRVPLGLQGTRNGLQRGA